MFTTWPQAEHAQIDPLHPNHVQYVFLGDRVDLRGFPHPPFNAWFLGLLLAAMGDIREVPFHAAYILFSVIAALAMWSLAKRFSPHPLWATLLFLAVPAFVINGNSFESDLPFLAFWMAAVACFVAGRWTWAAIAMVLAALSAFQAVFLTPILAVYVWIYRRKDRTAWLLTLVAPGPFWSANCWSAGLRARCRSRWRPDT
jgi:Gpi18-like mannosyltransferase